MEPAPFKMVNNIYYWSYIGPDGSVGWGTERSLAEAEGRLDALNAAYRLGYEAARA